jgi:hypothetical protein
MALQSFDHRDYAVMATYPQVVSLGNIVGEDNPRCGSDSGKHRQQDSPFQGLGFIDDHKRIMQRAATDVGQGQNFNQAAINDFINNWLTNKCAQSIENRLSPRGHFFALRTWQVTQLLATDWVERAEDNYLFMKAFFHHRFKSGTQSNG